PSKNQADAQAWHGSPSIRGLLGLHSIRRRALFCRYSSFRIESADMLTRRDLLQGAFIAAFARTASPNLALTLAQLLNRTRFTDLPPKAIEHAKMIIASTLASAAPGSLIDSARIVRDLARERGGKPEATVWFDGAKLPVADAARVNAMLSDAAASDDSDLRNVAHTGTTLNSVGLAIGERIGATGEDLLSAIVTGYEAAGRIGEALGDNRQGFHASVLVP